MLKVILNRLKPQAEKIIAEEQAGFREGRSTTELETIASFEHQGSVLSDEGSKPELLSRIT